MRAASWLVAAMILGAAMVRPVSAQEAPAALTAFLDCNAFGCDSEHFQNEIGYVNWVRDRTAADVHLLVTSQDAGGGGAVYQLTFLGQRAFAGDSTTLTLTTDQNMTESERRDELTNRIAQGMMRYVVRTGVASRIRIQFEEEEEGGGRGAGLPVADPWNFWVFSIDLSGSAEGESRDVTREMELSLSAERVTEQWKLEFEVDGSYEEEEFELQDRTVTSVTRDWSADALIVKALAPLWSAGFEGEVGSSTFRNQDLFTRAATVLEYSFFPYDEFSRREITLQYSIGARQFQYSDTTIFGRLEELRYDQELELSLDFQQPWGSARTSLSGSHYLHDFDRHNLSFDAGVDVRLFRGFSLDISGGYERVHDQLHIPKGAEDDEDVLLRLRELETSYRYDVRIGIRYTFGSIYNNIVNPRMGRGGGGDFDGF